MSKLVLFDFDGTITTRNTFVPFLFYVLPWHRRLLLTLAVPILILGLSTRTLSVTNTHLFLVFLMRGFRESRLHALGREYFTDKLHRFFRPAAIQQIRRHLDVGDHVVVVTASYDFWIRPWCDELGLELISSVLRVDDGIITGQRQLVCDGPKKVTCVAERLNITDFDTILAYGDSHGDRDMLAMADEHMFKPFRD